jgi:hypothetical protein
MHRHATLEALQWTLILMLTVMMGCSTPITSHDFAATPTLKPDISDLRPGAYCKIETQVSPQANPRCTHVYSGTVASVTNHEIVLNNAVDECTLEYGMPVIDDIPYMNMLLKRGHTGHSEAGTVRLPIAEITWTEICEPPKSTLGSGKGN